MYVKTEDGDVVLISSFEKLGEPGQQGLRCSIVEWTETLAEVRYIVPECFEPGVVPFLSFLDLRAFWRV